MAECENNFSSLSTPLSIALGVANSTIGIIALFGNLLVLFVFYKDKKLHSRSSCCLLSLVMTDFLVGSLLQPLFLFQLFFKDARNMCGLNTFRRVIMALLMGASMSSIALISYDRYLLLSKGNQYNSYMTPRRMALLIFLCWFLPAVSLLFNTFLEHGYFSAMIFVYTFLMLLVISWSYFNIMRIVRKNESQLALSLSNTQCSKTLCASKNRIRAARAVMVILLCFVLSNAPLTCYLAIRAGSLIAGKSFLEPRTIDVLYVTILSITMVNSVINPIIYYYRIPNFRSYLRKVMKILVVSRVDCQSTNHIEASQCQ